MNKVYLFVILILFILISTGCDKDKSTSQLSNVPKLTQEASRPKPEYMASNNMKNELTESRSQIFDLLPIVEDRKWGFIDKGGNKNIHCKYDFVYKFSEGLAAVITKIDMQATQEYNSKMSFIINIGEHGFIDKVGNMVIDPTYDIAHSFSDGMAAVMPDYRLKKWGYIDKTGKMVIPPRFNSVSPFRNGIAKVVEEGSSNEEAKYIDKQGNYITDNTSKLRYEYGASPLMPICIKNKYGIVNQKGETIVEPIYDVMEKFSDGLALVGVGGPVMYYYLDNVLWIDKPGKFGYIDENGRQTIGLAKLEGASSFSDGMAAIRNNGKWGFIDKSGNTTIHHLFDEAGKFVNGIALVKSGGKFGYIDKKGKFIIQPQFEDAFGFDGKYAMVMKNGKWGYIDKTGNVKIGFKYDGPSVFYNTTAIVRVENEYGIIDEEGNYVVAPKYQYIERIEDGILSLRLGEQVGYLSSDGKWIWKPNNWN